MTVRAYPAYRDSQSSFLGLVPEHWSTRQIKHIARLAYGDSLPADGRNENGLTKVFGSNGAVGTHGIANTGKPVIVVGRKGSFGALNWSDDPVFVIDTAYYIDGTCSKCHLRWLFWSLHAANLNAFSQDTGVPGLAREIVHSLTFVAPSIGEQLAIAAFLDRETGKIDALVAEQERLITLLKEKRQAVISHAVTKGLNPDVPMKDSGVPWLGEVPAHWTVLPLARVTQLMCDGPFGSGLKSEHYTSEGARVIRLQNIHKTGFRGVDAVFIDESYFNAQLGGHDVRGNDILIAGLGDERNTVGRACVAPDDLGPALVKADCFRFRVEQDRVSPEFLALQLTSGAEFDAGQLSSGSTRSRIPLSVMATRRVALPSLPEQQAIHMDLTAKMRGLASLDEQATRAIALLRERRAALISAAVTGKIDVRDTVATEQHAA